MLAHAVDVRAGDAAVGDVAHDGDVQPLEVPLVLADGSRSSSAWVGCSWAPSPALTTRSASCAGQECGGAGGGVAHHDHVGAHGRDVLGGVDEALALRRRCEPQAEKLITSADSHLPAISNEVRVRVEAS